ncbi:MAG: NADAR family protein [Hymenobacteraceae bacterium]|nr:NADAR family protein [Hymenobacteraceae bacterium]
MTYDRSWLLDAVERGQALKFLYFWGHTNRQNEPVGKFCFSQWYESPFVVDEITYLTAEHWMMAQKAQLFGDTEIAQRILKATKPGEVKQLGREISGFEEAAWVEARYEIVRAGNSHKFSQHPALAEYLRNTADRVLVEASPVDPIWGIGLAQDDPRAADVRDWQGLNLLGFALMEVRDELRARSDFSK